MSSSGTTMSVRAECLSTDNPSELVALLERDHLQKARQFAQSGDMRKDMEPAGVSDRPGVYFLEEIERPRVQPEPTSLRSKLKLKHVSTNLDNF